MIAYVIYAFSVFDVFAGFLAYFLVEPIACEREQKKKKNSSKTQTNGEKAGAAEGNGGPLPARRFLPRFREPARRTAALTFAPRCRRGMAT